MLKYCRDATTINAEEHSVRVRRIVFVWDCVGGKTGIQSV